MSDLARRFVFNRVIRDACEREDRAFMKREPRDPDEIRIQKVVNGYILTIFIDPYYPASSAVRDSVVQVAETFDSLTSKLRFLFGAQDDVSPIR